MQNFKEEVNVCKASFQGFTGNFEDDKENFEKVPNLPI